MIKIFVLRGRWCRTDYCERNTSWFNDTTIQRKSHRNAQYYGLVCLYVGQLFRENVMFTSIFPELKGPKNTVGKNKQQQITMNTGCGVSLISHNIYG